MFRMEDFQRLWGGVCSEEIMKERDRMLGSLLRCLRKTGVIWLKDDFCSSPLVEEESEPVENYILQNWDILPHLLTYPDDKIVFRVWGEVGLWYARMDYLDDHEYLQVIKVTSFGDDRVYSEGDLQVLQVLPVPMDYAYHLYALTTA